MLTHDACGRVIKRKIERKGFRPKVWRYSWDAFDRLAGCVTPDEARWSYAYDPFGRRVEKRAHLLPRPGVVHPKPRRAGTRFSWDGDVVAEEIPLLEDGSLDLAERVTWHFEPGGFAPVARESAGAKGESETGFVVTDHLGTPREIADTLGQELWSANYRLWGGLRGAKVARPKLAGNGATALAEAGEDSQTDTFCPIRFPGQWADDETGLHYNRYQHYDPLAGQYASPDPIGLVGGARTAGYVDCANVDIDPLGLQARDAKGQFLGKNGENLAGPGKLFEDAVANAFRAKGDKVFRNVTVRDAKGNIISYADSIVVREGKVAFVVEAKSGRKGLSTGQRQVQDVIGKEQPLSFTGKNAQGIPGAGTPQNYPGTQFRILAQGVAIP